RHQPYFHVPRAPRTPHPFPTRRPSDLGCHALADAGSVANVGPNLDDAFAAMRASGQDTHFSDSTIQNVVLDQIRIAAPPMPANLVRGQDAADVAAYVASVAGKTPAGGDRKS